MPTSGSSAHRPAPTEGAGFRPGLGARTCWRAGGPSCLKGGHAPRLAQRVALHFTLFNDWLSFKACEQRHQISEYAQPGPRIRRGAWRQEICAARSLGKRVFCDNIKIATNARKLHCFGKFAEFMMLLNSLVLKLPTCGHSVMFTKV